MSTFYLVNSVRAGTQQFFAGALVDDAKDARRATLIRASGGLLWPSADPVVAAAAAIAQQAKHDGEPGGDRIMMVALLGRATGGVGAVTLVNGDNDNVVIPAAVSDLVASGPTGAYALKGFKTGTSGQRIRIKFNVNQDLTIKNNSSAGVAVLTGTGANAVFPATGGFLILDLWCDGTNWNVV